MFFSYIWRLVCHFNVIFFKSSSNNKRKLPISNQNLERDRLISTHFPQFSIIKVLSNDKAVLVKRGLHCQIYSTFSLTSILLAHKVSMYLKGKLSPKKCFFKTVSSLSNGRKQHQIRKLYHHYNFLICCCVRPFTYTRV